MSTNRYRSEPTNAAPGQTFIEPQVHEALKNPIAGYFFALNSVPSDRIKYLKDSIPLTAITDGPRGARGWAKATANQATITTEVALTGLSVTVVIPSGRLIRVTGHGRVSRTVADGLTLGNIHQDGVTVGRWAHHQPSAATETGQMHGIVILDALAAGTYTFKLMLSRFSGTGSVTLDAATTAPAYIVVDDLGAA